MTASADVIRIRAHDLGGSLHHISTPENSKILPSVVFDDEVITTSLTEGADTGPAVWPPTRWPPLSVRPGWLRIRPARIRFRLLPDD